MIYRKKLEKINGIKKKSRRKMRLPEETELWSKGEERREVEH